MDDQQGKNRQGDERRDEDSVASKGINPVQHSERGINPVQHSEGRQGGQERGGVREDNEKSNG